ncbi:MAG: tRNA-dihydrouridine synthase [Patescibacteria group bacterium]|nr:tRNA-dihydrouridine synthase [Patescibacteria group bacterium]
MKNNFWQKLKKPIMVLAPMADVTDAAFRRIIAKYGKPDVVYTQFVSCDGLCSAGKKKLLVDLKFTAQERPIVAQFFGAKPANFYQCAKLAVALGFDGIDINMGCPDKAVCKQGAGAALIKNPKLAREIIRETKRGAGELPVSIKTRSGDTKDSLATWLPELLAETPAVVIIHARTRKEMSKVSANWDLIKQAVVIRNKMKSKTLIIGNGDVVGLDDAKKKVSETGCDGIMFGRAIFGNPWLFNKKIKPADITIEKKLKVMVEHTKLFEKLLMHPAGGGSASGGKNFAMMKKHYKAYVNGFDGAKELRMELMECDNAQEVEKIVLSFRTRLPRRGGGSGISRGSVS